MEEQLNGNLPKCEGEVAIIRQLAVVQKKFAKAKEHVDEVTVLEKELEEWWETITAAAHSRSVRAAAIIAKPPAAVRRPPPPHVEGAGNMKLVGDLKPETLQHDSTAGDMRVWRKKLESYYTASNMHLSRLNVQQAHLLNCLDRELSLQLDSSIQATTLVTGNGMTCLSILTGIFEKKYPVLIHRKNFFSMAQQAGQDKRAFSESVKVAANKSDIACMTLEDAMCLNILTGCRDTRLKEKMSELETPTMAAFNILIDAHMHTKATTAKPATCCGTTAYKQKNTGRGGQNNSSRGRNVSDAEKKRRQIMKGKCFRCGSSEHFANNCSLAKDTKCKKCRVQ